MTIHSLAIEYDAINHRNTFSNGDILAGRVIVEVSRETKIKTLLIKAIGKANVLWTETYGKATVTYWDKEKCFSQTHLLIPLDEADSPRLVAGRHVVPFSFLLPNQGLPSSFKGAKGKIYYKLVATLHGGLGVPNIAEAKFTFVARPHYDKETLMTLQRDTKDSNVIFFASGNISMDVILPKTGFSQGEGLIVNGEIINSSTRKIVPKYIIYQKQSFFAGGHRAVDTVQILQKKGEPLASYTRLNLAQVLVIPSEIIPTIQNCSILNVEYRLKVILEVFFAKNPMIKMPLLILPQNEEVSGEDEKSDAGSYQDFTDLDCLIENKR